MYFVSMDSEKKVIRVGSSGNLAQQLQDIIAARGRYEKDRAERLSSFISS